MSERLLAQFTSLRFTPAYWQQTREEKQSWQQTFLSQMKQLLPDVLLYQVFPAETQFDLLLWNNFCINETQEISSYFARNATFFNQFRTVLQPISSLWGLTRPSDYARGKSAQEIDPFDGQRPAYLVVYPFVKTNEWYRLSRDTRQGMMNEHIRIGHQYKSIKQLLLYSTGLQDQEFVVIYEMDDLPAFSALVSELRSSEARRYTERDTPLFTAFYREPLDILNLFI